MVFSIDLVVVITSLYDQRRTEKVGRRYELVETLSGPCCLFEFLFSGGRYGGVGGQFEYVLNILGKG